MTKIAVLTRDCGGVNAAIRAVVRTAVAHGLLVEGVMRGYQGLIRGDFVPLDRRSVSNIIGLGGTILKTAREESFFTVEGQQEALAQVRARGIDGLIVIGGNGSLTGARILAERHGFPVVGIPATIDNDVPGVDYAIGTDTAVNVALDALDKIRDTATSLERIFVVEVMGRKCGWLAMQVALAGGCEEVLLPEKDVPIAALCQEIKEGRALGKASWIIVVAEG
ncbi:MAG: ATP-dependent 6-phosphofructokinase, partial [Candidatus Aminicenantales bacterium]